MRRSLRTSRRKLEASTARCPPVGGDRGRETSGCREGRLTMLEHNRPIASVSRCVIRRRTGARTAFHIWACTACRIKFFKALDARTRHVGVRQLEFSPPEPVFEKHGDERCPGPSVCKPCRRRSWCPTRRGCVAVMHRSAGRATRTRICLIPTTR